MSDKITELPEGQVRLPQPVADKLEGADRITVCFSITHEHRGEEPRKIPSTYSYFTESQEEPYTRRLVSSNKRQPLDLGWFNPNDVGRIVILNLEGKNFDKLPTEEKKQAIQQRVLSLSLGDSVITTIPPKEYYQARVVNPGMLRIMAPHKTSYRIWIFPK